MEDTEILIRGPEELTEEKEILSETLEDIGTVVGENIRTEKVEASDFAEDELRGIYNDLEGVRDFESVFEREAGGLAGGDMTSVLILQPLTDEFQDKPVMYVTDRPLFAQDWRTGETRHIYGVTQPSYQRPSSVLSTFAFQDMEPGLQDEMLETLTYHEGGHLLNEENPDREYRKEDGFGGGHCTNRDVMSGRGIWEDTRNRYENRLYCQDCTQEIREGLESF